MQIFYTYLTREFDDASFGVFCTPDYIPESIDSTIAPFKTKAQAEKYVKLCADMFETLFANTDHTNDFVLK